MSLIWTEGFDGHISYDSDAGCLGSIRETFTRLASKNPVCRSLICQPKDKLSM